MDVRRWGAVGLVASALLVAGPIEPARAAPAFTWPVSGFTTSTVGFRTHPVTGARTFHDGHDLDAIAGTTVLAVAPGTVVSVTSGPSCGGRIEVDHGDGYRSVYLHVTGALLRAGQGVGGGQPLATVVATAAINRGSVCSTGDHLHFEIRRDGAPVDWDNGVRCAEYRAAATPLPFDPSLPAAPDGRCKAEVLAANRLFVRNLFADLFARGTDAAGEEFWATFADTGRHADVARALAGSPEGIDVQLGVAFARLLGRPPDAAGRSFFGGQMAGGRPFVGVVADVAGSPEARARYAGDEAYVDATYRLLLGRPADGAGTAWAIDGMRSGRVPAAQFAATLLASDEGVHRRATSALGLLDRPPDPGGVDFWAGRFGAGFDLDDLLGYVAASVEYRLQAPDVDPGHPSNGLALLAGL